MNTSPTHNDSAHMGLGYLIAAGIIGLLCVVVLLTPPLPQTAVDGGTAISMRADQAAPGTPEIAMAPREYGSLPRYSYECSIDTLPECDDPNGKPYATP